MEKKSETLDAVDLGILRLLQADALMTTKEMGQQLGLTTTPIYERLRRLEKEGYVQQYTALLNRRRMCLCANTTANIDYNLKQKLPRCPRCWSATTSPAPTIT